MNVHSLTKLKLTRAQCLDSVSDLDSLHDLVLGVQGGAVAHTQYEPGPGVLSDDFFKVSHRFELPKPHEGIEEYFESGCFPVASGRL